MSSPVEIAFDERHLNGMTADEYADFCKNWVDVYKRYEETIDNAIKKGCSPLEELKFSVEEMNNPDEEGSDEGNKKDD